MSRAERLRDQIEQTKTAVFALYGSGCYIDDCPLLATECAHVLPQDELHKARYGDAVIQHVTNMRPTCCDHNATVQINYRGHPLAADQQAARVRAAIREET